MDDMVSLPRCYLLELPPGIRLQIYEHLWSNLSQAVINIHDQMGRIQTQFILLGAKEQPQYINTRTLALLQACKLIHQEAQPAAYQTLQFKTSIYGTAEVRHKQFIRFPEECDLLRLVGNRSVHIVMFSPESGPCSHSVVLRDLAALEARLQPHCARRTPKVHLWFHVRLTEENCKAFGRLVWSGEVVLLIRKSLHERLMTSPVMAARLAAMMHMTPQ